MKTNFFDIVHNLAILAYGIYVASFVLSDKTTDFEAIVAISLFLIVNRLEAIRDPR